MQIQLKQVEIVEALKQYITKKGFHLSGKTVAISFTAGRKDSGLTADIIIEDDVTLPDLTGELPKPVLNLVPASTATVHVAVAAIATPETDKAQAETVAIAAVSEGPAKSLFGS
jgi:hypothetical protein